VTSLFKKFLGKKTPDDVLPVHPDSEPQGLSHGENENIEKQEQATITVLPLPNTDLLKPSIVVGAAQSVGIQRDHNEDAIFSITTNLISGEKTVNLGLYIVADGMGGHENGEIASSIAVGCLSSYVINSLFLPLLKYPDSKMEISIQEIMQTGALKSHQAIIKEATGGGSTLTAALILGDQLTIAHVGDSRAYSIAPGGNLQQLTQDHSMVKRLVDIGQISAEQALTHPQRNVLYRALGQGEAFESDISTYHLQPGSQVILCTDGLWGVIPEQAFEEVIRTSPTPQLASQSLINLANRAGGPDNISAIIVKIPE